MNCLLRNLSALGFVPRFEYNTLHQSNVFAASKQTASRRRNHNQTEAGVCFSPADSAPLRV